jgi:hypothetical protein
MLYPKLSLIFAFTSFQNIKISKAKVIYLFFNIILVVGGGVVVNLSHEIKMSKFYGNYIY